MNCWHCNGKLKWCGDHDVSDEDNGFTMMTNLHCPRCYCEIYVYYPKFRFSGDEDEE